MSTSNESEPDDVTPGENRFALVPSSEALAAWGITHDMSEQEICDRMMAMWRHAAREAGLNLGGDGIESKGRMQSKLRPGAAQEPRTRGRGSWRCGWLRRAAARSDYANDRLEGKDEFWATGSPGAVPSQLREKRST